MASAAFIYLVLTLIVVPFAAIVALPIRVMYVTFRGGRGWKLAYAALLLPWGYFLRPILQRGYVSEDQFGTGPTVHPRTWMALASVWLLVEVVRWSVRKWDDQSQKSAVD
jgi:hypothetical protein